MATSDGRISIDIVANEKGFAAQLDSLAGMAKGMFGKALGGLAALGIGKGLVDVTAKAIDLASAAQQTANRVNAVFPQMSESINAFASRAMYDMGLSGGAAKNMMVQFGMMAQGMGYTEKQAANMSMQMTQLAGDMAAFYGITAEEAQSKLSGVFTGMTRGLKQLGVDMSEANLQAHALALGINQDVSSMTSAQLAALRLSYAQQQLAVTSGYAKQNMGTWAGQTQLLRQQINALLASMGKGLIAALLPLLKVINAVIAGLIQVANAFNAMMERITGKKFSEMMGGAAGVTLDLGNAAASAGGSTGDLAKAQDKATKAAEKQDRAQKKLNRTLAGFDKINKLVSEAANSSTPSTGGVGGIGGIGDSLDSLGGFGDMFEGEVEQAQEALDSLQIPPELEAAFSNLWDKVQGLAETISQGLKWAWDNILVPFGTWIVKDFAPPFVDAIAGAVDVLDALLEIVGEAFGPIWDTLLAPIAKLLGEAIVTNVSLIGEGLSNVASFLREHKDQIVQPFKDLAAWLGEIDKFKDEVIKITSIFNEQGPAEAVKTLINDIMSGKLDPYKTLDLTVKATAVMGGPYQTLQTWYEWAKKNVAPIIADITLKIANGWSDLKETWKDNLDKFVGKVVEISMAIGNAWQALGQKWMEAKDKFTGKVVEISMAIGKAWAALGKTWNDAKAKFTGKVVTIGMALGKLWKDLGGRWNDAKAKFQGATRYMHLAIGTAWSNLKDKWNNLVGHFKDISKTVYLNFSVAASNIRTWLNDNVASRINNTLNKVPLLNWGSRLSFAQGGFVPRNTPKLAVIGDNRREGEIVSPESKFQKMLDKASSGNSDAEMLAVLNAILVAVRQSDTAVYLDGREISRRVVRDVNAITQATGRSPILV